MAKEKLPLKTLTGIPFRINIDILKEIEEELELFLLEIPHEDNNIKLIKYNKLLFIIILLMEIICISNICSFY